LSLTKLVEILRFFLAAALDAALPLFYSVITPEEKQIGRGDAKFIDAIHTNGGIKGKLLPFADVDFFVNGGSIQPPCGSSMFAPAFQNSIIIM
jgi:hypothetical protein